MSVWCAAEVCNQHWKESLAKCCTFFRTGDLSIDALPSLVTHVCKVAIDPTRA
jgi:hypothetical protein